LLLFGFPGVLLGKEACSLKSLQCPKNVGNPTWGNFYGGETSSSNPSGTPDHYIHIGNISTLIPSTPSAVSRDSSDMAVFYNDGSPRAVDNRCPHMGFPLNRGTLRDGLLTPTATHQGSTLFVYLLFVCGGVALVHTALSLANLRLRAALRSQSIVDALTGLYNRRYLETVLERMSSALEAGESVKISGFGTFSVRQKGRRVGRNPKTGVEVPILPRRVLVFRPSQVLKAEVNGRLLDLPYVFADRLGPDQLNGLATVLAEQLDGARGT